MAKKYNIDVTDEEFAALSWKFADPHQAIDDFVTASIHESMERIAEEEIRKRLADPNWTSPIPANKMEVFEDLELKSALQLRDEDVARMQKMYDNPDDPEGLIMPEERISKSAT